MRPVLLWVLASGALAVAAATLWRHVTVPAVRISGPVAQDAAVGNQMLGRVPTAFVPNLGQWQHPARYVARFGAVTGCCSRRTAGG